VPGRPEEEYRGNGATEKEMSTEISNYMVEVVDEKPYVPVFCMCSVCREYRKKRLYRRNNKE
jgi:hypothetical protein